MLTEDQASTRLLSTLNFLNFKLIPITLIILKNLAKTVRMQRNFS